MTQELAIPNQADIDKERNSLITQCRAIQVLTCDAECETASGYLSMCKGLRKQIAGAFKPVVDAAHQAHKKACEMLKSFDEPVAKEEQRLSLLLGRYQQDKERIAKEEAAKIAAEVERIRRAQAEREAERMRLENAAKAEAARIEAERLRKEGQAKAALEAQERERLRAIAAEREAKEAALRAAQAPPVVVEAAKVEKATVETITFRENWKYEIADPKAIPREFMMPDEKAIAAYVRAKKGDANIPGVRVYCEKTAIGRG